MHRYDPSHAGVTRSRGHCQCDPGSLCRSAVRPRARGGAGGAQCLCGRTLSARTVYYHGSRPRSIRRAGRVKGSTGTAPSWTSRRGHGAGSSLHRTQQSRNACLRPSLLLSVHGEEAHRLMRSRLTIQTFGCRANQYDSDVMRALLAARYEITSRSPDLILLNACTVTALAERKARQAARRARRDQPHAVILLVGCLADAVTQGLTSFPEADLLAGNSWKTFIVDAVDRARSGVRGVLPPRSPVDLACERSIGPATRVRASLKIQDGCGRACSYCRPRQVRGRPRSKPVQAVLDEASRLVSSGICELILTGIDLAQYAPPAGSLAVLVRRIATVPGLQRLRLASINPSGITDALLDACSSSPTVCPHFHVPLQSGDDRVLRAMRRGYDVASYLRIVERIRTALPKATLGTDLIVGFPGEDEVAFANTCARVEEVGYVNVHIFRYSPRPGTEAYALPASVPPRVQRTRSETLLRRWEITLADTLDNRIGSTQDLLVEGHREASWRGYTRDYVEVRLISDRRIPIGSTAAAHITGRSGAVLEGVDDHRAVASSDDAA